MSEISGAQARGDKRLAQLYDCAVPAGKLLIDRLRGTEPLSADGCEKIVYDYGDHQVVAFYPSTELPDVAERLKNRFFTGKLMHLLSPSQIPEPYTVGANPPMMIMDKVFARQFRTNRMPKWATKKRRELCDRFYNMGVQLDRNPVNFLPTDTGTVVYVDGFMIIDEGWLAEVVDLLPDDLREKGQYYYSRMDLECMDLYTLVPDYPQVLTG